MAFSDMLHMPQLLQSLSEAWRNRSFPSLCKYFDLTVEPCGKADLDPIGSWPWISDIFYSSELIDGVAGFRVQLSVELRDRWLASIQRKQCVIVDFQIGSDVCRVHLVQKHGTTYNYDSTIYQSKDTMLESSKRIAACIDGLREYHRVQMNGKRLTFWYKAHSEIWNSIQAHRRRDIDVHALSGAKNKNPLNAVFDPDALLPYQVRDAIKSTVDILGMDVGYYDIEEVTDIVLSRGKSSFHQFIKAVEEA